MTYVSSCAGVNVGGNSIVSMAAIKEAFVALGLSDVRTYMNSGNVIFSTRAANAKRLTDRIEKRIEPTISWCDGSAPRIFAKRLCSNHTAARTPRAILDAGPMLPLSP